MHTKQNYSNSNVVASIAAQSSFKGFRSWIASVASSLATTKKERGAALIAAIMIIAIVAAIASDLMLRSQVNIQRTKLTFSAQQAELNNTYALAFAQLVYIKDFTPNQQKDPNYKPPQFPIIMDQKELDNVTLNANFNSAQGLFNLNNLSDPAYVPLFAKLIQAVDPEVKQDMSMEIANSLAYFIGTKTNPELEKNYTTLNPPYRAAHHFMASPTELRLVDKVTVDLYQKILPFLIALPKKTSLNPSVAPKPVLMAYGISADGADAVINAQNRQSGIKTLNDFYIIAQFKPTNTQGSPPLFDLKNNYFLLTATIQADPINWTIYTLLEADKMGKKLNLIQETLNTL
jgi:general secretion pathway protein K